MDELQKCRQANATLEKELMEAKAELQRFTRVFEIEAALEKVRARTINMRASAELSDTSALLFKQLKELGIDAVRAGVGIFDDENSAMELWLTTTSDNQEVIKILYYFSLYIHPVFENIIPARQQNKPFSVTKLKGKEVLDYYQTMSTYLPHTEQSAAHDEEFFYSFFFLQGTLNVVTTQSLTIEECSIIIQFANAFGLIYTRFLDLQNAELQTRGALRQNSLDRVRAEIASMRNASDLERITPLIWKELGLLGVPFFRCGVFIVNEEENLVHAYLSTPNGKSLGALNLPMDEAEVTKNIVHGWRNKEIYQDHWDSQQFHDWVLSMARQGQISTIEQYEGESAPDSLSLQFIPFSQGMLYIGSHEPLEYFQIDLVSSLADSFSVAYARYEDFKQLEFAKNRIESALSELKATQSQLIQAEKMASLGELTAGIAHEIQNPLNFVNNFSEVNSELLTEMGEELEKENYAEVKAIAKTIEANQEKISQHGKRADSIVKGMLQHSRISSGQKEPTDINALAAEYLKLSYHGLRAKDKSFNANLVTDFDDSIGTINIVSQDIGRALLNLFNNAFYAVTEKQQESKASYEPTVWITTKRVAGKIEITIRDNGSGIPERFADKIFQPFFTSKPSGKGTGLGLSLTYDIIKTHGGEIRVETKEGEGSAFIITL